MKTYQSQLLVFRIAIDLVLICVSFFTAVYLAHGSDINLFFTDSFYLLIIFCVTWYAIAKRMGLFDEFRASDYSMELWVLIKTLTVQITIIVLLSFGLKEELLNRSFVAFYGTIGILLLSGEKYLIRKVLVWFRLRGRNLRHVIMVGAGYLGRRFQQYVQSNPHYGYRFIGYLDYKSRPSLNGDYLGDIEKLEEVLMNKRVHEVIIALPSSSMNRIQQVINTCENYPVHIRILPDYGNLLLSKFRLTRFDGFPVISVRSYALEELHWRFVKRSFDIGFTLFLFLTVFWWLMPLIALGIKLSSKGPVLFKQERWGRGNEKITCYKFRSMIASSKDIDSNGHYRQATKNDPRVTGFGGFIRSTNLDEIPQFFNVLKGNMSIVGPRPHPTPLNIESKNTVQYYLRRHLVKPGITGWAQINGCRGETVKARQMQKRVEHDIWYIENWSFFLDIKVIFKTILGMIKFDPMAY